MMYGFDVKHDPQFKHLRGNSSNQRQGEVSGEVSGSDITAKAFCLWLCTAAIAVSSLHYIMPNDRGPLLPILSLVGIAMSAFISCCIVATCKTYSPNRPTTSSFLVNPEKRHQELKDEPTPGSFPSFAP